MAPAPYPTHQPAYRADGRRRGPSERQGKRSNRGALIRHVKVLMMVLGLSPSCRDRRPQQDWFNDRTVKAEVLEWWLAETGRRAGCMSQARPIDEVARRSGAPDCASGADRTPIRVRCRLARGSTIADRELGALARRRAAERYGWLDGRPDVQDRRIPNTSKGPLLGALPSIARTLGREGHCVWLFCFVRPAALGRRVRGPGRRSSGRARVGRWEARCRGDCR
jgi:hypothetical protein